MSGARQLMVSPITNRIFDGVPTRDGLMPDDRVDRTEECIRAVMAHMDGVCKNGQHTYVMDGVGALTFIQFPKARTEGSE